MSRRAWRAISRLYGPSLRATRARLALIIHLIRVAAGDPRLKDSDRVDESSMADAIALTQWFGNEARRVYAMLDETDGEGDLRRLTEFLFAVGAATPSEVSHGMQVPEHAQQSGSGLGSVGARRALEWVTVRNPKGGPPTRAARLIRGVTVTETPESQAENKGSGDSDGKGGAQ